MMLMVTAMVALCGSTVMGAPRERNEEAVPGPSFCFGRHCPPFETVSNEADYEVRTYPSMKWLTTEYTMDSNSPVRQSSQAFMRLFRYIQGSNSEGVKIPMTVPVITITKPDGTFVRSFFLPSDQQDNPPQPTEEGVYIEEKPEMTVFVKSYNGWKNPTVQQESIDALQEAVGEESVPGVYYKAGYGPYRSSDAYNEIWMVALEDLV